MNEREGVLRFIERLHIWENLTRVDMAYRVDLMEKKIKDTAIIKTKQPM